MKSLLANSHRIIIKVGSSLVTNHGEGLDQKAIASWVEQISHLVKSGKEIVLVSPFFRVIDSRSVFTVNGKRDRSDRDFRSPG